MFGSRTRITLAGTGIAVALLIAGCSNNDSAPAATTAMPGMDHGTSTAAIRTGDSIGQVTDSIANGETVIRSATDALLQIGRGDLVIRILSFIAILLASINIFGGFAVTRRMLGMFVK